ncbi:MULTISPECIES: maleylacetoacetate isomerase [Sphingopyxis]|uniref:maleylacetoacetate isomerase n=1 Tax=Sphingopyxis TaxID=165697 RepID=UPI00086F75F7|nr:MULTISPECIES: maleylacetoacetate isomerase [Sphingopyxis]APW72643.1 maleylacetoacetate isomerase [Sphingopyxis granuli]AVA13874.1 maleylacetoacetate isomerase [Sphingopyxis sp. MG]ODU29232.1 MAG: maleylacetoacetate isomerase [Sphingopyxis sp. SCN 67-31]QUM71084.1 maleylacetoacetate isomerase [Sphingopyxis granuli]
MTSLVLHDYFRSSASYRVRIALNLKGLAYERVEISLIAGEQKSDSYLAQNAQGFVPLLVADGQTIIQSLAIIDWLDRAFPEPRLIPDDAMPRAVALAQAQVVACDIHPLNNLRVLKYLKRDLGLNEQTKDRWYRHWIIEGFDALEAMAGDGRYLGGETPGIADCCLVPQMYNARRFDVPLDAYPRLVAIDAACTGLDAFQRAHPDAVKAA